MLEVYSWSRESSSVHQYYIRWVGVEDRVEEWVMEVSLSIRRWETYEWRSSFEDHKKLILRDK